jgi:hypothetical protein
MTDSRPDDPLLPVADRYVGVELEDGFLLYDKERPNAWIRADSTGTVAAAP